MKRGKLQPKSGQRRVMLGQRRRLQCEWLEDRLTLSATMVTDLIPGTVAANPGELTDFGGMLYFAASNGTSGRELWKSDGTAAGTVLVKDIAPNAAGSNPSQLTAVGGLLYFVADDGASGPELWKSNGTAAGTVRVADIRSGPNGSNPTGLTAVGSTLYFSADNGESGAELWSTSGVGAALVKDIRPGGGASNPGSMVNLNGTLYFAANDGVLGVELWKSTGTEAGTALVKDIRPASVGSFLDNLTVFDGSLYFSADDGTTGVELWRSDGTTDGTARLLDINPGVSDSSPSNLVVAGPNLFFSATTAASGAELWKSDGTTAGTVLLKDIRSGAAGSILPSNALYSNLASFGGTVFIAANDGATGIELWKSDGTAAGTVQVKDISPGTEGSGPFYMTPLGGAVYFSATNDTSGVELWKSDGTSAGTVLVQEIVAGSGGSVPLELTRVGGALYFSAADVAHGRELWRAQSTPGVVDRRVFYNRSKFDANDSAANAADDGAIAADKTALLPGGTATFANYTNYSRGLNGLILDIVGLSRPLVASDFEFRVGNNSTPSAWAVATAPVSVSTRVGAGLGGSDRVTIVWPDAVIKNQWLQVTLTSSTGAGLAQTDVFYFGNAVGETGDSAAHARVNATDEIAVRANARSFNNLAPLGYAWDINRDGFVNATDQILARANSTTAASALQLIAAPAALALAESEESKFSVAAPSETSTIASSVQVRPAADAGAAVSDLRANAVIANRDGTLPSSFVDVVLSVGEAGVRRRSKNLPASSPAQSRALSDEIWGSVADVLS